MRIYDEVSFMILLIPKILRDLKPFFYITLLFNILFATMYMVLEVELGNQYALVWTPLKWMVFTLRNALADFDIHDADGFIQMKSNET